MLFAVMLGVMVGAASVVLVQQWLRGSLDAREVARVALPAARYPHLAPPRRLRRAA
jgi:hypothetical protein